MTHLMQIEALVFFNPDRTVVPLCDLDRPEPNAHSKSVSADPNCNFRGCGPVSITA